MNSLVSGSITTRTSYSKRITDFKPAIYFSDDESQKIRNHLAQELEYEPQKKAFHSLSNALCTDACSDNFPYLWLTDLSPSTPFRLCSNRKYVIPQTG